MEIRLQDVASVRCGLVLSRKQAASPTGCRYPLINLRCVQPAGRIDRKEVGVYEAKEPLKGEYLSRQGDVVVRLTAPYTAVLIDAETSGMVIPSNFVVIRMERVGLLPEYLFWLLNTSRMRRDFYENATSNMLGAVKAQFLAEIALMLPPVEVQRSIAQLNLLAKKERQLQNKLADEKEMLYAWTLNRAYAKIVKGNQK